ncbi:MAG: M23 family metallopeptidase [Lachnospiraceae bacterium]|nr:M23 family metallopeptidase [Lachnospiraceae bacterium]
MTKMRTALFMCGLFFLLVPNLPEYEFRMPAARMLFYAGNTLIGAVQDTDSVKGLIAEARRELTAEEGSFLMPEIQPEFRPDTEGIAEKAGSDEEIKQAIKQYMREMREPDAGRSYTVKVNDTVVSVKDADSVKEILDDALAVYDTERKFEVKLVKDTDRELSVLKAEVMRRGGETGIGQIAEPAGAAAFTDEIGEVTVPGGAGFDAFDYGLEEVGFSEVIEICESRVDEEELLDKPAAADQLTGMQAQQQIYKVESGDTLSVISLKVELPLDEIIALNDELENENSIIRPGQELLITVPEPALSVLWTETARCEEVYDLPIEYVYNDEWYTNKKQTLKEPSAGYREAVNRITRKNDEVVDTEVLYEEVGIEAVAKVVEVGTIEPPTYIKPLSGGRISSTFGRRSAPKKGASTYHKGVDIAVPSGTSVWASSGGTVTRAGWAGGYGNVVCIQHADGKETRYGHLSKIYVKAGQKVRQGQVIAASGSTGVSTGPHLHFEIRIGGEAVNPMNYVNF